MDEMVTTPEAAKYLDVCAPHIRLLLYRGDLEGEKIGRDLWVTKDSLAAYRENRRPVGRPKGEVSTKPSKNNRGGRGRQNRESQRRLQSESPSRQRQNTSRSRSRGKSQK